jgi:predicted small secreted protein
MDKCAQLCRIVLALSVLFAGTMALTACNTTAGAGEDISATGHAVTKGAQDVKQKL